MTRRLIVKNTALAFGCALACYACLPSSAAGMEPDINQALDLASSANSYDRSFIVVEHAGPASQSIYPHLLESIAIIPMGVKRRFAAWGVKVRIVYSLASFDPTVTDRHPPGWRDDATYPNTAALYHIKSHSVLIAEAYIPLENNDGRYVPAPARYSSTVLHELGHAFNRNLGQPSDGAAFASAFDADAAHMNANQQQRFAKDVQRAAAGHRGETFANLFMDIICEKAGFQQPRADVSRAFPRALAFVRQLVDSN